MMTVHVCINNEEIFCVKAVRIREAAHGRREYAISYRKRGKGWRNRKDPLTWSPIYGGLDLARTLLVLANLESRLLFEPETPIEKPPRCIKCGWAKRMHKGMFATYTFKMRGCQKYEPVAQAKKFKS